jgi:hypothetical protein
MRTEVARHVPVALKRIQQRLERWRRARRGRDRIPEELWGLAVEAVGTCGLNKTARALGLDYYSLKKRVESAADASRGPAQRRGPKAPRVARPAEVAPRFVELASGVAELAPVRSRGAPICVLVFERAGGAKLRVQLPSVAVADLVALGRSFWSARA